MGPGLSLQVVLGVPVGVKYHHGVGRRQVHPQSTCPRRQEETEVQRSLCVEMVNGFLPYVPLDGAVQSLGAESFILVTTFGYLYNHAFGARDSFFLIGVIIVIFNITSYIHKTVFCIT